MEWSRTLIRHNNFIDIVSLNVVGLYSSRPLEYVHRLPTAVCLSAAHWTRNVEIIVNLCRLVIKQFSCTNSCDVMVLCVVMSCVCFVCCCDDIQLVCMCMLIGRIWLAWFTRLGWGRMGAAYFDSLNCLNLWPRKFTSVFQSHMQKTRRILCTCTCKHTCTCTTHGSNIRVHMYVHTCTCTCM